MTSSINDLKRQIAEKNSVLASMDNDENYCRDDIKNIKAELDRLLYQYYKRIRFC